MQAIPMDQLDEYEQGENVRKWLRQNGGSLIAGIGLGLACVFGWQWWQGRGVAHQQEAAIQYAAFTDALTAKDAAKAKTFAAALAEKYANTPYAELAALRHAGFLQAAGKPEEALQALQAAAPSAKDPAMVEMFELRQARLLLIGDKASEALKRLDTIKTPLFPEIAEELRGDIQIALGHRDDARKAYERALTALDQASPTRRMVELKLIEAGGQPPAQPEA